MSISRSTFLLAVLVASLVTATSRAEDLAGTVAAHLRDSGALSGYRVNVKSKSGTVWLEGQVGGQKQLASAVSIAENTEGVERVVNRLSIANQTSAKSFVAFSLPESVRALIGLPMPAAPESIDEGSSDENQSLAGRDADEEAAENARVMLLVNESEDEAVSEAALAQAVAPGARRQAKPQSQATGSQQSKAELRAGAPRPLGISSARPMPYAPDASQPQGARSKGRRPQTVTRASAMGDPMQLPAPGGPGRLGGYEGRMAEGQAAEGQIVPGSMRMTEGTAGEGYAGGSVRADSNPGIGRPMPMGSAGVGMPPVPMRGDGPNMPKYSWPSYAASPNYAAVQYPTQYSPTAWPYIGPFYPYPQVPLGWRRVSLEWDDGWWFLDFDDRHQHSHHR
ncbi:MAG: BON domain-containing protein [Planctomycetia bacterium]|nr:BON domain-containing protein [Planctomycetia bacterium]